MSPKPYESLDVTAKSSTKGNCIILNIREGHSIGPYAYQLTSSPATGSRPTRPNVSPTCSTPHWTKPKTNEKETSHDQQTNPNPCGGTRMTTAALIILTAAILTTAALAGCGARGEGTSEPDPRTSTACKRWSNTSMRECVVELQDTRRVTCVSSTAGMSCDWAHADGADKEPTR